MMMGFYMTADLAKHLLGFKIFRISFLEGSVQGFGF